MNKKSAVRCAEKIAKAEEKNPDCSFPRLSLTVKPFS